MKVIIVGGGNSAWSTAAYFATHNPEIDLHLIKSPDIPTIGVGESSTRSLKYFFELLNIKEEEWMKECDATHKFGNIFLDWGVDKIYHLFDMVDEFSKSESPNEIINKHIEEFDYHKSGNVVSYHFDAQKMHTYFEKKFGDKINIIIGTVDKVNVNNDGIDNLTLTDGNVVDGDFFIDCTGLHRKLIQELPGYEFEPNGLVQDRCVFSPVPYQNKEEESYKYLTTTAKSAGWIFRTPIQSRIGSGYVFSSKYLSDEDAIKEFMEHWDNRPTNPRIIKFRNGKIKESLVQNCVAIGLSSGIVDPMESTAIGCTCDSIFYISWGLNNGFSKDDREFFNDYVSKKYNNIVDFVSFIYYTTDRDDSQFWKDIKTESRYSKRFINMVKLFEENGSPYVLKDGDDIVLGNRASGETWRDGDVFDVPMWYLHGISKGLYE